MRSFSLPALLVLSACSVEERTDLLAGDQKRLSSQMRDKAKNATQAAQEKGSAMLAEVQKMSGEKLAAIDTTIAELEQKACGSSRPRPRST